MHENSNSSAETYLTLFTFGIYSSPFSSLLNQIFIYSFDIHFNIVQLTLVGLIFCTPHRFCVHIKAYACDSVLNREAFSNIRIYNNITGYITRQFSNVVKNVSSKREPYAIQDCSDFLFTTPQNNLLLRNKSRINVHVYQTI